MTMLLESIRIQDRTVCLPDLHQERMNRAFAQEHRENLYRIEDLYQEQDHQANGLFKWRIRYDTEGFIEHSITPYAMEIKEDFELVNGNHISYSHKYANRFELEQLKNFANAEEIIITQEGFITDTSFSNLIFKKENAWFTPRAYLLNGVMRQKLLAEKKITETDIHIDNLLEYDTFQLINAMIPMGKQEYSIAAISNLRRSSGLVL